MSETEGFILNTVQTPTPLRTVYQSIRRGHTTRDAIEEDTVLESNLLDQGINGLIEIGLIGRQEPDYYTVDYPWETGDEKLDFRMAALHQLATDAQPDEWGKQSAVLLNYQYLLQENIQMFEANDKQVYTGMEQWWKERGYTPRSQQGAISMNEPKMVNWTRTATFLGLIYKAKGRRYTTTPDERLIYQSIRWAADDLGKELIGIRDYIEWLNANLLLVDLDNNYLPATLSRILFNLVKEGRIRITESGDAGAVGLTDIPSRLGIDSESNSIEVIQ
ncbi:hypothetical protein [Haladaptatus sp. YSMS36]|uniref:hypothetical protein n=1 Tax=Haladaptatus sp. YSMS36 TaxID=3033384 RepID=UPI0023E76FB3|nr:hypothetical protein [Haladaptatus sp. YSMS36]